MILGWFFGAIVMIGGYLLAGGLLYGFGPALAEVPGNIGQVVAGGIVGIPLVLRFERCIRRLRPLVRQGRGRWRSKLYTMDETVITIENFSFSYPPMA